MAEKKSLLSKLADTKLFHWIAKKILVPYWAWRQPTAKKPGGPPPAVQPTQNVQHMMNLVTVSYTHLTLPTILLV